LEKRRGGRYLVPEGSEAPGRLSDQTWSMRQITRGKKKGYGANAGREKGVSNANFAKKGIGPGCERTRQVEHLRKAFRQLPTEQGEKPRGSHSKNSVAL